MGTNLFSQEDRKSGPGGDGGSPFRASAQWWILLLTILPLTALTFLGWSIWRKKSEARIETKIMDENKEATKLQEFQPIDPKSQRRRSSIATLSSGLTKFNSVWSRRSRTEEELEMGKLPV